MANCPRCRGTARTMIAPGYYQCQTVLMDMMPGMTPAGPGQIEYSYVCGNRYHDGATADGSLGTCACGTLAIAVCGQCASPVCGDHSVAGMPRLCTRCVTQENQRAAAAKAEERQARIDRVRAAADPTERLLLAVKYLVEHPRPGEPSVYQVVDHDALAEACPEVWRKPGIRLGRYPIDGVGGGRRPWDSAEIARWFANRANARGIPTDCVHEAYELVAKRMGRGYRRTLVWQQPCWEFPIGGLRGTLGAGDAYVSDDGLLDCVCFHSAAPNPDPPPEFGARGLLSMLERLGLDQAR